MMRVSNIEKVFAFALKSLQATDIMPKRAAADFWAIIFHQLRKEN
jgi:hypothetical protein